MKDIRVEGLAAWARSTGLFDAVSQGVKLLPVSDDASFRRYFRFSEGAAGMILVDAPPGHEDNESYIKVSTALHEAGLNCPRVLDANLQDGYLAITDLGDRVYLTEMQRRPASILVLYDEAVAALLRMLDVRCDLPDYDEQTLRAEMSLFEEWFLYRQLGMHVGQACRAMLENVYALLVANALAQPVRFVHRDYHCRNLMVTRAHTPGILDFQDALVGPITYDLVSLLKDCYYRFDRALVEKRVDAFRRDLIASGLIAGSDPVLRWFDLMGAQRHLKCAGIFSRLNIRDGKAGYLGDIPLVIEYLLEVSDQYDELATFGAWLRLEVVPRLGRVASQGGV